MQKTVTFQEEPLEQEIGEDTLQPDSSETQNVSGDPEPDQKEAQESSESPSEP